MADCTITDILKELPNIIFAITGLIAVIKGAPILQQHADAKVEANALRQQEVNLRRDGK